MLVSGFFAPLSSGQDLYSSLLALALRVRLGIRFSPQVRRSSEAAAEPSRCSQAQ